MDLSEILLWVIVGSMLLGMFAKGAMSEDPNTSCLTLLTCGLVFVGGGLTGIIWGVGKLTGWW
jgi:hypothetical protein